MPINKYLISKEKAMTNQVFRKFNELKKKIQKILIKYDTQKDFNEDLKRILDEFNLELALIIKYRSKDSILKASVMQADLFNSNFKIDWNLPNEPAQKYLDDIVRLHSSHYIEGSIGKTTYVRTLTLVRDGLKESLTYGQIAKQITELDPLLFSKGRAENIAISELGYAFEYGKNRTMKDIIETDGEEVQKKWSTVNDERVRPKHMKNQSDGWIGFDDKFSGTNSLTATDGSRCRCSTIYKII